MAKRGFLSTCKHVMTLQCAASCRLQSKKLDEGKLGLVDRIAYIGHLAACRSCRRLHKQFEVLQIAIESASEPPAKAMPAAVKQRLEDSIQRYFDSECAE